MKRRIVHEANGQRTIVAVLELGDEVCACLEQLAREERHWRSNQYRPIPASEQAEILSRNGDITLDEKGAPKLHLHTVLGRHDGSTVGGHLNGSACATYARSRHHGIAAPSASRSR